MRSIGIDVGGTNLKAGVVDENYHLLYKKKVRLQPFSDGEEFGEMLLKLTQDVAKESGTELQDIAWVGVGFPGIVDDQRGVVVHITNLVIDDLDLRRIFRDRLGLSLHLGNDANCAALGEYYAGAGAGSHSLVVVTLGTGVGGGIVVNGKMIEGYNGTGAEVGHMVIIPHGEQCNCGRRGCYERYASANALKKYTAEAMEAHKDSLMWKLTEGKIENVEGYTAFDAARAGDPWGKEVCETYIDYVALGAANLINIIEPEVLAFGGGVCEQPDLMGPLAEKITKESFAYGRGLPMTKIVRCTLGNDAGIIGAAMLGK